MHGVFIEQGPMDWQIIQQERGTGILRVSGSFIVPQAAIDIGVSQAQPVIRIMSEDDNSQIISWKTAEYETNIDRTGGRWRITLEIPAGGLYRIETGLDTVSFRPGLRWIFRGDVRLHIGIGDIFVVAGQSNSAGYAKDPAFDPPDMNVHLFRNRGTWDIASHPINESTGASGQPNVEMGVSGTSPYIAFGRQLSRLSHVPVGLISTAQGGQPISRWEPDTGDLYTHMLSRIRASGSRVAGILWYQGCSDANPGLASDYAQKFKSFVLRLRKELDYQVPFFIFQLNRFLPDENHTSWGIIKEAQRVAAKTIDSVFVLPTSDIPLSDDIHNSSPGNLMLGERLAKLTAYVLYSAPEYSAPDIVSAEVLQDGRLSLTFAHMRAGFQIYQTKSDNYGFTVEDSKGIVPLVEVRGDLFLKNLLIIEPARKLSGDAVISFAYEANPISNPIVDETTYLPLLSFYKFPVRQA